jgi:hypothetical protein
MDSPEGLIVGSWILDNSEVADYRMDGSVQIRPFHSPVVIDGTFAVEDNVLSVTTRDLFKNEQTIFVSADALALSVLRPAADHDGVVGTWSRLHRESTDGETDEFDSDQFDFHSDNTLTWTREHGVSHAGTFSVEGATIQVTIDAAMAAPFTFKLTLLEDEALFWPGVSFLFHRGIAKPGAIRGRGN